jgi:hypothetical protein
MSDLKLRQLPPEADALLKSLAEADTPEEASRLLANLTNRAIAMLHKLARDQAAARKGQKDWATWAKLAAASRNAVLAASMTREVANQIAAAQAAPAAPPAPDRSADEEKSE